MYDVAQRKEERMEPLDRADWMTVEEVAEPVAEAPPENGEEPKPKKKTRRGTRGGRGRKRKPVESSPEAGQESPLV